MEILRKLIHSPIDVQKDDSKQLTSFLPFLFSFLFSSPPYVERPSTSYSHSLLQDKHSLVRDKDLVGVTSKFKDQVAGHFSGFLFESHFSLSHIALVPSSLNFDISLYLYTLGLLYWHHEGVDILFKRGEDAERLEREIRFYEDVQTLPIHHPSSALSIVPKYHGLLCTDKHNYIVLESITAGMGEAVVADIKLGRVVCLLFVFLCFFLCFCVF